MDIFRDRKFSFTTNEIFPTPLQVRLTNGLRVPINNIESADGNLIHRRRCANETFAQPGILFKYGVRYSSLRILGDLKGNQIRIGFFYGYSMLPNRVAPIITLLVLSPSKGILRCNIPRRWLEYPLKTESALLCLLL
jgi:hypothetical protein